MADNLNVSEGSGKVIATDEIAGVHYVKEKLCFGAADSVTLVASAAGSGLPIEGISGGAAVSVSASGAFPVTDNSGSLTVDNAGTFAVQAAQSGTWTVGISSAQTLATVTNVGTVGTITNVVHVDDNSSTLSIDDGGSSITVDGTIAFSNSTIAVTNSGTFAVQAVCTNAGTFAVQATVAAGATNIAKAEDAASADADVGVPAMAVRKATPANTSGTDGDYEMLQMSAGRLWCSTVIDTSLPAGTNAIGKLASNSGVTIGAVEIAAAQTVAVTNAGTFAVQVSSALPAGTNAIGKLASNTGVTIGAVEIASSQTLATVSTVTAVTTVGTITNVVHVDDNSGSLTVDNSGTFAVQSQPTPVTSGGCAISRVLSSASSNTATSVKGSAGQVYAIQVSNTNASARYLKLYNTSSTPTGGSGTPVMTLLIPGNASGASGSFNFPLGIAFSSGIGLTLTTGVADNDTGALSANEVIVNVVYK